MEERIAASPAWELLHGADRLLTEVIAGRDLLHPRTLAGVFNELLTRPLAFLDRTRNGGEASPFRLLAASALCYALYGAAAGFFQGGDQILIAALKAPLIIFFTLLHLSPPRHAEEARGADLRQRQEILPGADRGRVR